MTINYICKGFDKDFYNFDAIVVPVVEAHYNTRQEVYGFRSHFFKDFRYDFSEIIQLLPISAFKPDGVMAIRSEKKGIYYIFVLIQSVDYKPYRTTCKINREVYYNKNYTYCCKKVVQYINNLDVKNVLIHPAFNQVSFIANRDSEFLAKTLENNIDRFSQKNIYILVEGINETDSKVSSAFCSMEKGTITPKECAKIYVESQMEKSMSYTNSLIKIAEIETKYKKESIMEQFWKDINNDSWFFEEYIKRYPGTATELARNAEIDDSTISKIKNHDYKEKTKKVVLSLAIALDLTADDRKRFINSAGFVYPKTEQDRFIEQQLRKKRYHKLSDFNSDIVKEHPKFIIETRASKGYNKNKSDK